MARFSLKAKLYRKLANAVVKLTGHGSWFFARHLAPGHRDILQRYLGRYRLHLDTTYPIESTIWLFGYYDDMMMRFAEVLPGIKNNRIALSMK